MTTPRTAKVEAELVKAKAKLTEQQDKIKELEQKRTEYENTEIVEIVRGMNVPLDQLAAMLTKIKDGSAASEKIVTKPQPAKNEAPLKKEDEAL